MIDSLKKKKIKKYLIVSVIASSIFVAINIIDVIKREEAHRYDKQTKQLNEKTKVLQQDIQKIGSIIDKAVEAHNIYNEKMKYQQKLIINSNKLYQELNIVVDALNKYYDNSIFKLRLQSVNQSDIYVNLAEIVIAVDFYHTLNNQDINRELEISIQKELYKDIFLKINQIIALDKKLSKNYIDSKQIKLFYIREGGKI